MTPDVRRVGPEAAAVVLSVVEQAFGARPLLDPPADAMNADVESVASMLGVRGGLVASLDGVPAGCLIFDVAPDALVLRRFGVTPEAQGRGVAAALVQAALRAAIGRASLLVVAREELPGTIDFWRRHGFAEHSRTSPRVTLRRGLSQTFDVPDGEEMRALGAEVGRSLTAGDLVVLTGELGAGKTTFTQGLGLGLGVRGAVTSPTFVIARVHPSLVGGPELVHVDAYRLGGLDELDDLDLDTSLEGAVTVVEWGAGLAEGLADSRLEVIIERALGETTSSDEDPRRVSMRWVTSK